MGTDLAAHAIIQNGELKVDYGTSWKEWLADPSFPDFPYLIAKLSGKLEKYPSKGIGKAWAKGTSAPGKGKGSTNGGNWRPHATRGGNGRGE